MKWASYNQDDWLDWSTWIYDGLETKFKLSVSFISYSQLIINFHGVSLYDLMELLRLRRIP